MEGTIGSLACQRDEEVERLRTRVLSTQADLKMVSESLRTQKSENASLVGRVAGLTK